MLNINILNREPDQVKRQLADRLDDPGLIDELLALDDKRRKAITKQGELRRRRNENARSVRKAQPQERQRLIEEGRRLGRLVSEADTCVNQLEQDINRVASLIPNIPHPSVPEGRDADANVEVSTWGRIPSFEFKPRPHWEIGEPIGLDIARGVRMAGSRFYALRDQIAHLELALLYFMIELHVRGGYELVIPPFLVNEDAMHGCAQLPKFEGGLFKTPINLQDSDGRQLYLVPTAESALASMHRDEILHVDQLPISYVGCTPCFRRETSSGGRDVRGIKRVHQFLKVELFKFVHPDNSYDELESLTSTAETVLRLLDLPYRKVILSSGDMGFGAAKTYDLEVWLPSEGRYVEVSSCSNVEAFQARRVNTKFRDSAGKTEYVHMLNGSGLAVGRTMIAILENYQHADGSVSIPHELRRYMGGRETLQPQPAK